MQLEIARTACRRALASAACILIVSFSCTASADPPSRVARLGYIAGAVSFSPAGENDWVRATLNRPLGTGDRLWTDAVAGARAEIQVGGAMIRMGAGTSLSVLNLDDGIAQLQVTQGSLNVRVRHLEANQVLEVDTPNLAFTVRQPGEFRIAIEPQGGATTIIVRQGKGEVYGEDAAYVIDARQPYRFAGTGLREYELVDAPRLDEFDRWASGRDRDYANSLSAQYVSPDVVGYQDLDANGTWRVDATYGNVWVPNRVADGWAPYSDGHWAWVDPWGWTWIDDAPWGFAVSHYGRWANLGGTWGWVPGPTRTRAYYAPALVAFVGGSNFQLSISGGMVGGIAWFPLAPREVYRPSYPVSRGYFENINHSNTAVNNVVINQQYNSVNVSNVTYINQQVSGAVIAVPATAFVQSQPVASAAQRVSGEKLAGRPVTIVPAVAPNEKSVRGASAHVDTPPPRVFERPVVARTAIPAALPGFAAQREQLIAQPGRPLDSASRKELKPEVARPVPIVKVLAPRSEAQASLPPPLATPEKTTSVQPGKTLAPVAPAVPAMKTPEGRGKPGQDRSADTQVRPPMSSPDKPALTTSPDIRPLPSAVQEPAPQTAKVRGKAEVGGSLDVREKSPISSSDKPTLASPPTSQPLPGMPMEAVTGAPKGRAMPEQDRSQEPKGQRGTPNPVKPVIDKPADSSQQRGSVVKSPDARGRTEPDGSRTQRQQEAPPSPSEKPPLAPPRAIRPAAVSPPEPPEQSSEGADKGNQRKKTPPPEVITPQKASQPPVQSREPPSGQGPAADEPPSDRRHGRGDSQRDGDNRGPEK